MIGQRTILTRFRYVILAVCVLVWLTAFTLTHIPLPKLPPKAPSDKVMHLVGYFGLSFLFAMTLITFQARPFVRRISVLLIMPLYAAFDELTQPLVNRHAAWGDWFSDVFGILAALILIELILIGVSRISPKPSRSQAPCA